MPPCHSKRWKEAGVWSEVHLTPCPRYAREGWKYCLPCAESHYPDIVRTDTCGVPKKDYGAPVTLAPHDRSYEGHSDWPYLVYHKPRKRTWRSKW